MEAALLLWIHDHAQPWLDALFRFSHELGTASFCTGLVTIAVLWSLLSRRRDEALLWLALGLSTYFLQRGIKIVVARPRPDLWHGPIRLTSYAFPSGHAIAAATFYPLLGRALGMKFPAWKRAALFAGVVMAGYVGLGRLYLGVHWPSDVLAGWMMGAAQTYAGLYVLRRRAHGAAGHAS